MFKHCQNNKFVFVCWNRKEHFHTLPLNKPFSFQKRWRELSHTKQSLIHCKTVLFLLGNKESCIYVYIRVCVCIYICMHVYMCNLEQRKIHVTRMCELCHHNSTPNLASHPCQISGLLSIVLQQFPTELAYKLYKRKTYSSPHLLDTLRITECLLTVLLFDYSHFMSQILA